MTTVLQGIKGLREGWLTTSTKVALAAFAHLTVTLGLCIIATAGAFHHNFPEVSLSVSLPIPHLFQALPTD